MSDERANQKELEKRALVIEVLDKGVLRLGEAGVLASLLAVGESPYDAKCNCDTVCGGCDAKCGCIQ